MVMAREPKGRRPIVDQEIIVERLLVRLLTGDRPAVRDIVDAKVQAGGAAEDPSLQVYRRLM